MRYVFNPTLHNRDWSGIHPRELRHETRGRGRAGDVPLPRSSNCHVSPDITIEGHMIQYRCPYSPDSTIYVCVCVYIVWTELSPHTLGAQVLIH